MDQEEDGFNSYGNNFSGQGIKLTDIEARQRLLKERMLLIGENLVDIKEELGSDITELKKSVAELKEDIQRIKLIAERLIRERNNYARKSEVDVLKKQAQMFQPLELATKEYVDKKHHRHSENNINK